VVAGHQLDVELVGHRARHREDSTATS
jgi:hypothetical protein